MYLLMLFTLFTFYVFMFNKYHFRIILVLFIVIVSFYVCVYIHMYTHLFIINSCIFFVFCLLFIFDYLLFDCCHVYLIISIALFSFNMNMYVGINMYFVSHSPFVAEATRFFHERFISNRQCRAQNCISSNLIVLF